MFGFQSFLFRKTQKTLNTEQKVFSKSTILVFSMFSKTVLKNSFQKHEPKLPNRPLPSSDLQRDLIRSVLLFQPKTYQAMQKNKAYVLKFNKHMYHAPHKMEKSDQ